MDRKLEALGQEVTLKVERMAHWCLDPWWTPGSHQASPGLFASGTAFLAYAARPDPESSGRKIQPSAKTHSALLSAIISGESRGGVQLQREVHGKYSSSVFNVLEFIRVLVQI